MTAVIVKKNGLADPDDRIEGMILAGDTINNKVKDGTATADLFDLTFDELSDVTGKNCRLFVRSSSDKELSPMVQGGNRQKNKYKYDTPANAQLHIQPQEDDSGTVSPVKRMSFVSPGMVEGGTGFPDMLASGYVGTIATDCERILGATPSAAEHKRLMQYLLANVFLSRCH